MTITDRAKAYPETEVIFYDIGDILDVQKNLNDIVNASKIDVTISDHIYALVNETSAKAELENNSKTDTYQISVKRKDTGASVLTPIELGPGKSMDTVELLEIMEFGNYDCIATIAAIRDGKTVGTMDVNVTLHVAYLWAEEG